MQGKMKSYTVQNFAGKTRIWGVIFLWIGVNSGHGGELVKKKIGERRREKDRR